MAQKDLKPVRSKDEAKARGKKGGIASGKSRAAKKTLREALELLLAGKTEDGTSRREAVAVALLEKALTGDVRAFEALRDTVGEKPVESVQAEVTTTKVVLFGKDA